MATDDRCEGGNSQWWQCVLPKGHEGECRGYEPRVDKFDDGWGITIPPTDMTPEQT